MNRLRVLPMPPLTHDVDALLHALVEQYDALAPLIGQAKEYLAAANFDDGGDVQDDDGEPVRF